MTCSYQIPSSAARHDTTLPQLPSLACHGQDQSTMDVACPCTRMSARPARRCTAPADELARRCVGGTTGGTQSHGGREESGHGRRRAAAAGGVPGNFSSEVGVCVSPFFVFGSSLHAQNMHHMCPVFGSLNFFPPLFVFGSYWRRFLAFKCQKKTLLPYNRTAVEDALRF